MREANTVLGIIKQRGRDGLLLQDVYRQLYNPALYLAAYGRIYSNRGSMTSGVTPETADGMSLRKINDIIAQLREERFRWTPVRRIFVPKSNGRQRPLGIPTWSDKLLQEVVRSILEAYYEPRFSDRSHGFRPGKGCHTALRELYQSWYGVKWFIEGDIKGCFDNIDHVTLMSILRQDIRDGRFTRLLEQLLGAGYLEAWSYHPTLSGTPQGGIVSPILSNIYLDRLDRFVTTCLVPEYTRGCLRKRNPAYQRLADRAKRLKRQGRVEEALQVLKQLRTLPAGDPLDANYRRLRYVRYADDFLLGFAGPREEAEAIKERIRKFLLVELKLEMSPEKTLLTHARTQSARFLGYDIAVMDSESRRSVNGQPELRIPPDRLKAFCDRYRRKGRPVHRPERLTSSDFDIVALYGSELRGVAEYYKFARNRSWLNLLRWLMEGSLLKTLANKHRSTCRRMRRKYRGRAFDEDWNEIRCIRVVVPRDDRGKPPLIAVFGNMSFRRRMTGVIVDQLAVQPDRQKRTELIQRLLADKCEWCGATGDVEVHHIRKLSDLERGGRKKPLWVKVMAARKRKTMVLCGRCHDDLHAGRLGLPSCQYQVRKPELSPIPEPALNSTGQARPSNSLHSISTNECDRAQ